MFICLISILEHSNKSLYFKFCALCTIVHCTKTNKVSIYNSARENRVYFVVYLKKV